MKKILKRIGVLVIVLFLVLIGWVATLFNKLPEGVSGDQADEIAEKMLASLNYKGYMKTEHIAFTFRGVNHYEWNKNERTVRVQWNENEVLLEFKNGKHLVIRNENSQTDEELIEQAIGYFYNDSFWLVAPFKVMDRGVERQVVDWESGYALRVTYTSGGKTPGDSYLWILDEDYRPVAWRLWTSNVPIKGLEIEWANWQQLKDVWFAPIHPGPGSLSIDITNLVVN